MAQLTEDILDFRDNPKLGDGNPLIIEETPPATAHFRDNPKLGDGNKKKLMYILIIEIISEITPN